MRQQLSEKLCKEMVDFCDLECTLLKFQRLHNNDNHNHNDNGNNHISLTWMENLIRHVLKWFFT